MAKTSKKTVQADVESRVLTIRGQKVIPDADLACLYGVQNPSFFKKTFDICNICYHNYSMNQYVSFIILSYKYQESIRLLHADSNHKKIKGTLSSQEKYDE